MSNGIILAKPSAGLATCRLCGKPAHAEQTWRGVLCVGCWTGAAKECGWLMEPMMGVRTLQGTMLYPQRLILPAMVASFLGARGDDRTPARALARLLWERLRLMVGEGDAAADSVCCYCCDAGLDLVSVEAKDGWPAIWHCKDFRACDARVVHQIAGLVERLSGGGKAT